LQGKSVPHLDQGSLSLSTEARTCYKGEPSCRMNLHLKVLWLLFLTIANAWLWKRNLRVPCRADRYGALLQSKCLDIFYQCT